MPGVRMSRHVRKWGATHTTITSIVLVAVAVGLVSRSGGSLDELVGMSGLVGYPLVLASAAFVYVYWRLCDTEIAAWLSIGLAATGAAGLAISATVTARPELLLRANEWLVLTEAAVAALVLWMAVLAEGRTPPWDPMAMGVATGLVLAAAFAVATVLAPPALTQGQLTALVAGPTAAVVALVWFLVRHTSLPPWCSTRIAAGVAMVSLGDVALALHPTSDRWGLLHLAAVVGGAVLLFCTTMALLRSGIADATRALSAAGGRVAKAEERLDRDRARMHEIGSTFAGIASASRLITADGGGMPDQLRPSLERMLHEEMARLERLLEGRQGVVVEFDLDTVLQRLVLSHQARGHLVSWSPSGERVVSDPDEVAEVVDILLDNAAKHGHGTAEVSIRRRGDVVEVSVADEGGIALAGQPDGERIFAWGQRGESSRGQGIGLAIARRLAERQGGYLTLGVPSDRTTFTVGLLTGERSVSVAGHLAS